MKKVLLSLVTLVTLFALMPFAKAADNKVKLYMFTKNGCSACEYAFTEFEKRLEEYPDEFELVNIEVWCGTDYTNSNNPEWILGNEDAFDLMQKAIEYADGDTTRLATPTIMVGDFLQVGANDLDALYDKIDAFKKDKKYKDVVAELAKEANYDISSMTKPHGAANCDIIPDENNEGGKYDLVIFVSVMVVLVGGFAGLIIISKK